MGKGSAVFDKAPGIEEGESKLQRPPESRYRIEMLSIDFVPWIAGEMIDSDASMGRWGRFGRKNLYRLNLRRRPDQPPESIAARHRTSFEF